MRTVKVCRPSDNKTKTHAGCPGKEAIKLVVVVVVVVAAVLVVVVVVHNNKMKSHCNTL